MRKNQTTRGELTFWQEQWALARLSLAFVACTLQGHQPPITIMWKDDLFRGCPRCGAEI